MGEFFVDGRDLNLHDGGVTRTALPRIAMRSIDQSSERSEAPARDKDSSSGVGAISNEPDLGFHHAG